MNSSVVEDVINSLAVVVAFFAIWITPVFLMFWLEKRLVWPYVSVDPDRSVITGASSESDRTISPIGLPKLTAYAAEHICEAEKLNFRTLGTFRDRRRWQYRVRYSFWRSQDGDSLAIIACGWQLCFRAEVTFLLSFLEDSRCVVTVDNLNMAQFDPSGIIKVAIVEGASFQSLVERHRRRVAAMRECVVPFSENYALSELLAYSTSQINELVATGYAKFCDSEAYAWRFTFAGALVMIVRSALLQFSPILSRSAWLGRLRKLIRPSHKRVEESSSTSET